MYTDCKQTARVLYIFWTGMKCQNLSFRPITTNIGNAKGKGSTIANANANANANTFGTTFGTTATDANANATNANPIGNTATNANANANADTFGNPIGNTATNTITIANSFSIGNGDGTPRREYLWWGSSYLAWALQNFQYSRGVTPHMARPFTVTPLLPAKRTGLMSVLCWATGRLTPALSKWPLMVAIFLASLLFIL